MSINLLNYISDIGYPRGVFISLNLEQSIIRELPTIIYNDTLDDGMYLDTINDIPILYKLTTKSKDIKIYDEYIPSYFLNSCIKNILILNNDYSNIIKCNSIVYMFYYYSIFKYKLTNITKITENVIMYILNTIKILQDKADTLYRNEDARGYIEQLRVSLQMEQINNGTDYLNIR